VSIFGGVEHLRADVRTKAAIFATPAACAATRFGKG
jgi:hypothetical protein